MPRNPDRRWVTPLRMISTAVLISALLTMLVSMAVLFNNKPSGPTGVTMRRAAFGAPVPARENRLARQPLAWVPVTAFGVALAAFGIRIAGDWKRRRIEVEKARLGIFPPPRQSRWARLTQSVMQRPEAEQAYQGADERISRGREHL